MNKLIIQIQSLIKENKPPYAVPNDARVALIKDATDNQWRIWHSQNKRESFIFFNLNPIAGFLQFKTTVELAVDALIENSKLTQEETEKYHGCCGSVTEFEKETNKCKKTIKKLQNLKTSNEDELNAIEYGILQVKGVINWYEYLINLDKRE